VDLFLERHIVRETARRNTYTGKTYNSLEHIEQFFASRSRQAPAPEVKAAPAAAGTQPKPAPVKKKGIAAGSVVNHPRWGRGMVLRREGDGEQAKLTISFPGYGIKKILQKFAGLVEE